MYRNTRKKTCVQRTGKKRVICDGVDKATWRNGYAEDCKSLYPGSIPGVASIPSPSLPDPCPIKIGSRARFSILTKNIQFYGLSNQK